MPLEARSRLVALEARGGPLEARSRLEEARSRLEEARGWLATLEARSRLEEARSRLEARAATSREAPYPHAVPTSRVSRVSRAAISSRSSCACARGAPRDRGTLG